MHEKYENEVHFSRRSIVGDIHGVDFLTYSLYGKKCLKGSMKKSQNVWAEIYGLFSSSNYVLQLLYSHRVSKINVFFRSKNYHLWKLTGFWRGIKLTLWSKKKFFAMINWKRWYTYESRRSPLAHGTLLFWNNLQVVNIFFQNKLSKWPSQNPDIRGDQGDRVLGSENRFWDFNRKKL